MGGAGRPEFGELSHTLAAGLPVAQLAGVLMRHGRIHSFTAACGLAVSLTAIGAEPPSTTDASPPVDLVEPQAGAPASVELEFSGDVTGPQETTERNCWDSSTWEEGESAESRCDEAGFLLGEQAFDTSEGYPESFFLGRPDPLSLRPMYSEELLRRFDSDQDGTLSGQERTTTEVFLEARRASHKASMTYRFDYDENDELSAAEKLEARRQLFLEQTESLNVLVETFDADRDGVLDETESMTARLKDAEAFFEVEFYEGRHHTFAYRDGPGLSNKRAEAFEEEFESLKEEAKADQREILGAVFITEDAGVFMTEQTASISGEQSGDREASDGTAEGPTETVAEVPTQDDQD